MGGTVRECQIKCDKDVNCKGFSYRRKDSVCFMFVTQVCGAGQALPGDTPCINSDWCNYDKTTRGMVSLSAKYVCPEQLPICQGYVPNIRWGKCTANMSE